MSINIRVRSKRGRKEGGQMKYAKISSGNRELELVGSEFVVVRVRACTTV